MDVVIPLANMTMAMNELSDEIFRPNIPVEEPRSTKDTSTTQGVAVTHPPRGSIEETHPMVDSGTVLEQQMEDGTGELPDASSKLVDIFNALKDVEGFYVC